ncbi:CD109 antigen-like isoform X2 [Paramacrobiotus metropolitanus]|uniref:CD109 antigen-like isoform X2 n=1 Tax=Paramacrobiotus metropolitanus TaxID=2943436 RepID=UPI0024462A6D|nr:CD109 antigen-like isoform X2 [Paramacrobiotus metropolitanus]
MYQNWKPVKGTIQISVFFDFQNYSQEITECRRRPQHTDKPTYLHNKDVFCSITAIREQFVQNNKLCMGHKNYPYNFRIVVNATEDLTGKTVNQTHNLSALYCRPFRIVTDVNEQTGKWLFRPEGPHHLNIWLEYAGREGLPYRFPPDALYRIISIRAKGYMKNTTSSSLGKPKTMRQEMPTNGTVQYACTTATGSWAPDIICLTITVNYSTNFETNQSIEETVLLYAYAQKISIEQLNNGIPFPKNGSLAEFRIRTTYRSCKACDVHYSILTRSGIRGTSVLPQNPSLRPDRVDELQFEVTEDMWPKAKLLVYYVDDRGNVVAEVKDFRVLRPPLTLNVSSVHLTRHGTRTACASVNTGGQSLVAFSGIDRGLLKEVRGKLRYHHFKPNVIDQKLNKLPVVSWFSRDVPMVVQESRKVKDIFEQAHIIAHAFVLGDRGKVGPRKSKPDGKSSTERGTFNKLEDKMEGGEGDTERRDDFRDSFLFEAGFTDEVGNLEVCGKLPDSLTDWSIMAFSIDGSTGLKVTDNSSKLLQQQRDISIDLDMPYEIVQEEKPNIQLYVYNNGRETRKLTVEAGICFYPMDDLNLSNCARPFSHAYDILLENGSLNACPIYQYLPETFFTSIGTIKFDIDVRSDYKHEDRFTKTISVIPKGIARQAWSPPYSIELGVDKSQSKTVDLSKKFPQLESSRIVPESRSTTIIFSGDTWSSVLHSLAKLNENFQHSAWSPFKCGEKNMAFLMINTFLAKYSTLLNIRGINLEMLKNNIQAAYDRQKAFRMPDGSYNTFGDTAINGSTWLTAHVVRGFILAGKFITPPIDTTALRKSLKFLSEQVALDGSFVEHGISMDTPSGSGVSLTAFSLLAFIEAKYSPVDQKGHYEKNVSKAMRYLENQFNTSSVKTDPYTLAITSYALVRLNSPHQTKFIAALKSLAKTDGNRKYWNPSPKATGNREAIAVETAAYALLTCLRSEASSSWNRSDCEQIFNWLLSKRNPRGDFISTTDTVAALHALEKTAERTVKSISYADITVQCNGDPNDTQSIQLNNTIRIHSVHFSRHCQTPQIRLRGKGTIYYQIQCNYNELQLDPQPGPFEVTHQLLTYGRGDKKILKICFRYLYNENPGTVFVEAEALTGCSFEGGVLLEVAHARSYEVDLERTNGKKFGALIQFTKWNQQEVCVEPHLYKEREANNIAARPIKISRYYGSQNETTTIMYPL